MTLVKLALMLYFFMIAYKAACQSLLKVFLKCMDLDRKESDEVFPAAYRSVLLVCLNVNDYKALFNGYCL